MPTFLPTEEDRNEHACKQQQANDEYYKVILFHNVYTILEPLVK